MKPTRSRKGLWTAFAASGAMLAGAAGALLGNCGPFTDVAADAFCPFVLEIFYLGITTGTTATTYDPTANVSRLQMAAFLSRTVDGVLKRGSRRAALNQYWTTQNATVLGLTTVPNFPYEVASDGADLWVASQASSAVARVRASDGKLLETWTGASGSFGVLTAMGRVLVNGSLSPGRLYAIDPSQPAGAVTTVATNLGVFPLEMAFDGTRVWTANEGAVGNGSVSLVTPGAALPWTVTTVTTGFARPTGIVFDGSNIWVTDPITSILRGDGTFTNGTLLKLSSAGAVLLTVTVGFNPGFPVFDGSNIWVPNTAGPSVSVVRASTGAVLATLTGNGMVEPYVAAFNGERVAVLDTTDKVLLFKAADLSPLGSFSIGTSVASRFICSDGLHFWISLNGASKLARF